MWKQTSTTLPGQGVGGLGCAVRLCIEPESFLLGPESEFPFISSKGGRQTKSERAKEREGESSRASLQALPDGVGVVCTEPRQPAATSRRWARDRSIDRYHSGLLLSPLSARRAAPCRTIKQDPHKTAQPRTAPPDASSTGPPAPRPES